MAQHQKRYLAFVSFVFLAVAALLPFLGLEQFRGDLAPVLMSLVAVSISGGALIRVARPTALETYIRFVSLGFVVLMLASGLGMWITESFTGSGLDGSFASGAWTGF
ncbi:MAG: hypothetical protein ACOCTI_05590 [Phycisphaeraceae bacterium]